MKVTQERKLKGTKVVCRANVPGCESSMERKFLEHSLLRSESSRGAKVPCNVSSWTFCSPGANVPRNESSTGAKVVSMDFSLPGTKVQRNEKASYPLHRLLTGVLRHLFGLSSQKSLFSLVIHGVE